jgi:hypothetical protein
LPDVRFGNPAMSAFGSKVDHADWLLALKFDGFRAAADTIRG